MIIRSVALLAHNLFTISLGILGLTFLIAIHEFGHFLFCKLFRIHTPTFSIGFGPQLLKKKIGTTTFALSAIPLGGYVEIAGLAEMGQGDQKEANRNDNQSFNHKPYWQKLLVMLGGISCNLLFAYFSLILLFFVGFPKTELLYPLNANTTIQRIHPDSPAAAAHLEEGDTILAVNDIKVAGSALKFKEELLSLADQEVTLTLERNNTIRQISIPLSGAATTSGKRIGILGVEFQSISLKAPSLGSAIKQGISLTHRFIVNIAYQFVHIFKKGDISSMGGPVQIISATVKGAGESLWLFLFILAMISINLAVLNVIPLPILDGGQVLYFTIEAIIGRPLSLRVREYIHMASWLLILSLILYLSAQDIYRLIKPWFCK